MRIVALALLLGMAFSAPADDTASTKAPRVIELKPDALGNVRVPAMQNWYLERIILKPDGKAGSKGRSIRTREEIEIECVKDLKFYDTAGKAVPRADALKALAKGGTVVVCGDKQSVTPEITAAVRPGTLVLVAPDLVLEPNRYGPWEDVP